MQASAVRDQQDAATADITSNMSKTHNKSNLSLDSEKTKKDAQQNERQESVFEIRQRRDAFLLRFRKGGDFLDKVIQEVNLYAELEKKASDKYWQEISSVSITPNAKTGLG